MISLVEELNILWNNLLAAPRLGLSSGKWSLKSISKVCSSFRRLLLQDTFLPSEDQTLKSQRDVWISWSQTNRNRNTIIIHNRLASNMTSSTSKKSFILFSMFFFLYLTLAPLLINRNCHLLILYTACKTNMLHITQCNVQIGKGVEYAENPGTDPFIQDLELHH